MRARLHLLPRWALARKHMGPAALPEGEPAAAVREQTMPPGGLPSVHVLMF